MQTFLPFPDFAESARALDQRRLGKQRVEVLQILRALTRPTYGWQNHPAVRMWRGHEEALASYGQAVCREWCGRGHADTCAEKILAETPGVIVPRSQRELAIAGDLPPWLGDDRLHAAHQSALVRKDPEHYRPLFADVPDDMPQFWPVEGRRYRA